ncbi:hypothetical protein GOBAR_AA23737 [Gossypium barbadense]|uniref:Uncharacterized protein n=1 Tax=Gossypium barbadense TaxID=3634 RepID=A0A2P5X0T1_GOSBA|nr:hypothetical protein GOBAR_AA23737 [Gossypium barbadense]
MGDLVPIYLVILAFFCTAGAIALAVLHIYRHLLNYTEPIFQRYIVRIIFMVPVYALMSFLSLVLPRSSIYFNSIREGYEAWVIYNFLSLCLAWVGGPGAVVLSLSGRVLKPSWYLMTCCLPPMPLDGRLFFYILLSLFILMSNHKTAVRSSGSAVTALYNGVMFFLAAKSGFIKDADAAAQFQNFIICVEMLLAALGHLYAFPYKEYAGANIGMSRGFTRSLAHALMLNDFYHDTVHQVTLTSVAISQRFLYWILLLLFRFAPTYHDYVLYNHNDGDEGTRKYRSRTFVPTGPEMDAARRNKHMIGNKLEDIQLSSLPSYGTSAPQNPSSVPDSTSGDLTKSSLLVDHSNSYSAPYDMSLIDMDLSSYPSKVPAAKDTEPR